MNKIRIVIADDHSLMRIGLKSFLSSVPDMDVVGEAENGEQALDMVLSTHPDVVVMDLMMPVVDGAEATRRILAAAPETKVIILTSYGNSADLLRAIEYGAVGAQTKEAPTRDLASAIRTVHAGKTAIMPDIAQLVDDDPPPAELTKKQATILQSVQRGLSNRDIAKQFDISENSVKKHLKRIFVKIGAATRAEAVAIALRKHLLKI